MSNQFVGEIRVFPYNFAPQGWAICQGQLMAISQNTALFSLLGVQYGGNGTSTFGLPNLQGNIPVGQGQGPGLSNYEVGETGGAAAVTLSSQNLPGHTHTLPVSSGTNTKESMPGTGTFLGATASRSGGVDIYALPAAQAANPVAMLAAGGSAGGGGAHNNLAPYLTLTICIALQGIFPPRS